MRYLAVLLLCSPCSADVIEWISDDSNSQDTTIWQLGGGPDPDAPMLEISNTGLGEQVLWKPNDVDAFIPIDATLISAEITFEVALAGTDQVVGLYEPTEFWDETVQHSIGHVELIEGAELVSNATATWPFTRLLAGWRDRTIPHYGLLFESRTGTDTIRLWSIESDFKPIVTIEYEPVPEPNSVLLIMAAMVLMLGLIHDQRTMS